MTKNSFRQVSLNDGLKFSDYMKKGDKFECDLKEVLKGLSNIFMRIFGSMNGMNGEKVKNSNTGGFNAILKKANGGLTIPGTEFTPKGGDELKSS